VQLQGHFHSFFVFRAMASGDQKKQSTMSFLVGAISRAVISGLAFYGAKKLYEDYWKGGAAQNEQQVEEKPKQGPSDSDSGQLKGT
jgi:hypothetical protein